MSSKINEMNAAEVLDLSAIMQMIGKMTNIHGFVARNFIKTDQAATKFITDLSKSVKNQSLNLGSEVNEALIAFSQNNSADINS